MRERKKATICVIGTTLGKSWNDGRTDSNVKIMRFGSRIGIAHGGSTPLSNFFIPRTDGRTDGYCLMRHSVRPQKGTLPKVIAPLFSPEKLINHCCGGRSVGQTDMRKDETTRRDPRFRLTWRLNGCEQFNILGVRLNRGNEWQARDEVDHCTLRCR